MASDWQFKSGDWHLICDSCGSKIWFSQSKTRWDGFQVCSPNYKPGCWEPRQPLDFLKTKREKIVVPIARPDPPDTFITVNYVDTGNNTIPSGNFNNEI